MGEIVGGHALEHHGGGLLRGHSVRHLDELRCGNQRVFGIAAEHADRGYRIAGLEAEAVDAGAAFFHSARGLAARDHGKGRLVLAFAEVEFDEVHADRFDANEHLTLPGRGNRQIDKLEDLRSSCFTNLDGFHDRARITQGAGKRG